MHFDVISLGIVTIIFSVVLIWVSIRSMLSEKSISDFLSFLSLGVALSFYSSFILFEYFFIWVWAILESVIFVNLLWIFFDIWRFSHD